MPAVLDRVVQLHDGELIGSGGGRELNTVARVIHRERLILSRRTHPFAEVTLPDERMIGFSNYFIVIEDVFVKWPVDVLQPFLIYEVLLRDRLHKLRADPA